MARALEITIDYVPDRPGDVYVDEVSGQIDIGLPNVQVYLYQATAEALRDALVRAMPMDDK